MKKQEQLPLQITGVLGICRLCANPVWEDDRWRKDATGHHEHMHCRAEQNKRNEFAKRQMEGKRSAQGPKSRS